VKDERFDLEDELRAGRSQPRDEFVAALAGDVRGRVRRSRIGLTVALCGLAIVAVASFGGIGYAASNKPVKSKSDTSSASAQYNETPTLTTTAPTQQSSESPVVTTAPENTTQTPKEAVKAEAAAAAPAATPKPAPVSTSSQLPFTGLALWIPLAIGLVLIAAGVVLRTRAKRHGSGAH
jgi:cell division septation protein DedD